VPLDKLAGEIDDLLPAIRAGRRLMEALRSAVLRQKTFTMYRKDLFDKAGRNAG
jgi:hypothetical protein